MLRYPEIMEEKCLEKEGAAKWKKQGIKQKLREQKRTSNLCKVKEGTDIVIGSKECKHP